MVVTHVYNTCTGERKKEGKKKKKSEGLKKSEFRQKSEKRHPCKLLKYCWCRRPATYIAITNHLSRSMGFSVMLWGAEFWFLPNTSGKCPYTTHTLDKLVACLLLNLTRVLQPLIHWRYYLKPGLELYQSIMPAEINFELHPAPKSSILYNICPWPMHGKPLLIDNSCPMTEKHPSNLSTSL